MTCIPRATAIIFASHGSGILVASFRAMTCTVQLPVRSSTIHRTTDPTASCSQSLPSRTSLAKVARDLHAFRCRFDIRRSAFVVM